MTLISRRLRGLISARVVTIALPASYGTLRIEAADGADAEDILGPQLERAGPKSGVDSLPDDPAVDQEATRTLGARDLESRIRERLPTDVKTALYRIVQEALTNIVKHARATAVSIVLAPKDRAVTALIEGDGRGFTPDGSGEGHGLLAMGERLALLGGRLKIESSHGAGATIVAEVPYRE